MSDINVTPLVDVMLVLLVIFILAAPLLAGSIRLQLPRADGVQPAPAQARPIAVALDAAGRLYLQDAPVADEALPALLREIATRTPDAELALRADAAVAYGRVVQVLGTAHAAGLTRIGFVTEPAAQEAPKEQKP